MAKGNFIEYIVSDNPNKYPNDGEQGDYYYETAEIIKGVYKPGRIVTALYNGEEIETVVQDVGYGYFVMIDGKHFSKKMYQEDAYMNTMRITKKYSEKSTPLGMGWIAQNI